MKTTTQCAEILGVSERRVRALIDSGQLKAEKLGRDWLISAEAVGRRLEVQLAQNAWANLGISREKWGSWWASDPDELAQFPCPECGQPAFRVPPGVPRHGEQAACTACSWREA